MCLSAVFLLWCAVVPLARTHGRQQLCLYVVVSRCTLRRVRRLQPQSVLDTSTGEPLAEREARLQQARSELDATVKELRQVHQRLVQQLVEFERTEGREFMHGGRRLLDTIRQAEAADAGGTA